MEVDIHGSPIYFEIPILGGIPITATLLVTWGVMLVVSARIEKRKEQPLASE